VRRGFCWPDQCPCRKCGFYQDYHRFAASRPILHSPYVETGNAGCTMFNPHEQKQLCRQDTPDATLFFCAPRLLSFSVASTLRCSSLTTDTALSFSCVDGWRAPFRRADAALFFRCRGGACPARCQPRHCAKRQANRVFRVAVKASFLEFMEKAKPSPASKLTIQLSVVPAAVRASATMRSAATTRTMRRGRTVARRRIGV
jgi:hypothetical protein